MAKGKEIHVFTDVLIGSSCGCSWRHHGARCRPPSASYDHFSAPPRKEGTAARTGLCVINSVGVIRMNSPRLVDKMPYLFYRFHFHILRSAISRMPVA